MKKALLFLSPLASLIVVPQAFAALSVSACPAGDFSPLCLKATDLGKVIANAINLLFVVAALLALGFLILGGIKWLTSQGEKEGIGKARETIVAAVVGLIIIFLSYLIVNFILNLFVGVNLFNLTLPTITGH
ncbi:MAG TPA: hypothetical protein VF189_04700 [Patescibacteria group bacterium]